MLSGPDPGIRFNTRIGRFVKSYLGMFPWSDNVIYQQAQGYWITANWQMFELTGDEQAKSIALACSDAVVDMQMQGGYWEYPNREWKDRIATVEGCFASLGLLESFARVQDEPYLDAVKRWFDFLIKDVGFRQQTQPNMWAINYFAKRSKDVGGVPNNSTLLLWLLARLHQATGEDQYIDPCNKLVNWLAHVQLSSGELPYALGKTPDKDRVHFLCFQYNAFEFMDLVHYYHLTCDEEIWPVIEQLAKYLSTGLTEEGTARFDCHHKTPEVPYYTVAIARALSMATDLGLGDYRELSTRAFQQVLSQQRADGGFNYHSRKNYRFLTDRRSYPRYLSMMLHHLLSECQVSKRSAKPTINQLSHGIET